jgi:hypothetical protein
MVKILKCHCCKQIVDYKVVQVKVDHFWWIKFHISPFPRGKFG